MDENLQESQKEALKDNELPEGVGVAAPPIEEYAKENEQVKDKLQEFGETDLEHFTAKVTSNAIFGKMVVRKLLGLDGDKPFVNLEHKTSPQENNVTGKLDASTYPHRIKGGPEGKTVDSTETRDN